MKSEHFQTTRLSLVIVRCRSLGRLSLLCLAVTLFAFAAHAQSSTAPPPAQTPSQESPVAIVHGEPIYESQFSAAAASQLQRMELQVYAVKRNALGAIVNQKLLQAAAKKKGVSIDELLKSEVDAKVPDPTADEVSAYYQQHQSQINQPFDAVKDQIKASLKQQRVNQALYQYLQALTQAALESGDLVVLLHPAQVNVPYDPARLRGDPKATVTIVEFSDFSCPFCRQAEPNIREVLAKYPDKVKLGYRDFPLSQIHPNAELAAEASRCAGEQGKYWDYHDLLFSNPAEKQDRDSLIEDARGLGLDAAKFSVCLSSGQYKPQIQSDVQMGMRAGVVGTPGFFVNGIFVDGAQPAAVFERLIDQELAKANQKTASN